MDGRGVVRLAWHMRVLLAEAPGLAMADLAVAMAALAAATVALAVVMEAVADTGVVGEPDPDFSRSRGCRLGPCRTNRFSDVANTPGVGNGAKTCWRDNAQHRPGPSSRNSVEKCLLSRRHAGSSVYSPVDPRGDRVTECGWAWGFRDSVAARSSLRQQRAPTSRRRETQLFSCLAAVVQPGGGIVRVKFRAPEFRQMAPSRV
jgi:hypothetical protein